MSLFIVKLRTERISSLEQSVDLYVAAFGVGARAEHAARLFAGTPERRRGQLCAALLSRPDAGVTVGRERAAGGGGGGGGAGRRRSRRRAVCRQRRGVRVRLRWRVASTRTNARRDALLEEVHLGPQTPAIGTCTYSTVHCTTYTFTSTRIQIFSFFRSSQQRKECFEYTLV